MSQKIQLSLPPDSLERLPETIPFDMLGTRHQSQAFQLIQKIARNGTARAGDIPQMLILWTQSFIRSFTTFDEGGKGAAGAEKAFGNYLLVTIFGKAPVETFTKLFAFRDYANAVFDHLPDVGGKTQCRHGTCRIAHDNVSKPAVVRDDTSCCHGSDTSGVSVSTTAV